MLTLVSCSLFGNGGSDSKESAEEIYEKIDEKMQDITSYEAQVQADVTITYMGYEMTLTQSGTRVVMQDYYYEQAQMQMSAPALNQNESGTQLLLYKNGYGYVKSSMLGIEQELKAQMSYDDFDEFINDSSVEIDTLDCSKKQKQRGENGENMLVFSGYSKTAVDNASDLVGLPIDLYGIEVNDIIVTIVYDEEYRCISNTVELVFASEVNSFSQSASYSSFNCAREPQINEDYTSFNEVPSLKYLSDITNQLDEIYEKEHGSFTLSLRQSLVSGGQEVAQGEVDNVTYGIKNGTYYYEIYSDYAGTAVYMLYENGTILTQYSGTSHTSTMSEAQARETVETLINSCAYDRSCVTDFELGQGMVTLTCHPSNASQVESVFTSYGGTMSSVSQQIVITYDLTQEGEMEIAKIESQTIAQGRIKSGLNMQNATFTLTSIVEIK